MAEEPSKDQQEKGGEGEGKTSLEARGPESWELLLARAEPLEPAAPAAAPPAAESPALRWTRALSPLLVLILYFGWKACAGYEPRRGPMEVVTEAPTLTGERPAPDGTLKLRGAAVDLVRRLEALRQQGEWRQIRTVTASQPAEVASHPVVHAFSLVARTRTGERSSGLLQELKQTEARLEMGGYREEMLHELRVARAAQMLRLCESPDGFHRNIDELTRLLGPDALTPFDVQVRATLADLGRDAGDEMMRRANEPLFGVDTALAAEGRAYYQEALRFVVKADGWERLEPVSPQARATVEVLRERIRNANQVLNGFSNPLTGEDSSTWDGRKGTAVHDALRERAP